MDRIHHIVTYIKRPKAKKDFLLFLKESNLGMPIDVRTRWNSTLEMVRGAHNRKDKLTQFIGIQSGKIAEKNLTPVEWLEVLELNELLKPLETATVDCSASDVPTVHLAVGVFDEIMHHLNANFSDPNKASFGRIPKSTFAKTFNFLYVKRRLLSMLLGKSKSQSKVFRT